MPELPELEIIKRGLKPLIMNQTITRVQRLPSQPSQHPAGQMYVGDDELAQLVIGARIDNIRRRAKVLIIDLSTKVSLMFHLRMTGQLVYVRQLTKSDPGPGQVAPASEFRFSGGHPNKSVAQQLPDKSTRTVIELSDGSKIFFNDQRKFGWIKVLPTPAVEEDSFISRLGPEPWDDGFTPLYLQEKLSNRTVAVKPAILDQTVVAGVGNIYADEALHLAGVHPEQPANTLSETQLRNLRNAIRQVMEQSIELGGTSFSNYVNHLGVVGDYLQHARVFRREEQPCVVCGQTVKKIRVAGRGTHFCPSCQVLKGSNTQQKAAS